MNDYKIGEIVDITIKGARVIGTNALNGAPTIVDEHGGEYPMPPQAAIERVAPAEWPPQVGDLWRDRHGHLHFAAYYAPDYDDREDSRGIDSDGVRVVLLPQCLSDGCDPGHQMYRPETANQHNGPLTLVHREGAES